MKRLVLVGGGHAHLSVLRAMAQRRPKDVELTLITPSAHQDYSAMLPGWISQDTTSKPNAVSIYDRWQRPLALNWYQ